MRETGSGELVSVRAFLPDDVEPLRDAVAESVPELPRYETWAHAGYTSDEAAAYVNWWRRAWADGEAYYFAVLELDSGAFLGSCGLSDLVLEHRRAGLGFWIRSGRTGEGFATDAARIVLELGFEDLDLNRIEIDAPKGSIYDLTMSVARGGAGKSEIAEFFRERAH